MQVHGAMIGKYNIRYSSKREVILFSFPKQLKHFSVKYLKKYLKSSEEMRQKKKNICITTTQPIKIYNNLRNKSKNLASGLLYFVKDFSLVHYNKA